MKKNTQEMQVRSIATIPRERQHSLRPLKNIQQHALQLVLLMLLALTTSGHSSGVKSNPVAQREADLRLCIFHVRDQNYHEAADLFTSLRDDNLLNRIVDQVYDNDVHNAEKILDFISNLPRDVDFGIGYEALYLRMLRDNQLKTPQLLLLDYQVKAAIGMSEVFELPTRIESRLIGLSRELDLNVASVIALIRDGTTVEVDRFANQTTSNNYYYLKHLISCAYSNDTEDIEMILKFLGGHPLLSHVAIGFDILYSQMLANNHHVGSQVFLIGYRIKAVMESSNYTNAYQKDKTAFYFLKSRLPETVKEILWGAEVCMKNVHYNEYLYSASWYHAFDGKRRRLFTWREQGGERAGKYHWRFVALNNGSHFKIVNTYYNEYVHAAEDAVAQDPERRNVFTWRDGTSDNAQFIWEVQHQDDETIKLRCIFKNEYLYAGSDNFAYNAARRNVFTRRSENMANGMQEDSWTIYAAGSC